MLRELAARIKATTGEDYNWKAKKIKYVLCSYDLVPLCDLCHLPQLSRSCRQFGYSSSHWRLQQIPTF